MRAVPTALVVVLSWAAPAGAEECRASPEGAFSFDVRLSPLAGGACLLDVAVYEGSDCRPETRLWSATRGCNETERMAITDRGNLVSILAPATAHRDWSIVLVLERREGRVVVCRLALEDIPAAEGLRGVIRPVFDRAAIRFSADVLVPFETLEALAGAS
jgi:hypothetical protein